ncbi:MAG: hypothetical protein Tsb002_03050 [Wenzhouxiangellaceae bacterium]
MSTNYDSGSVTSTQQGVHEQLPNVVRRHWRQQWRKPIASHNRRAFTAVQRRLASDPGPLILDSGCGVGESTAFLGETHADCWVIGVDKSAHRLRQRKAQEHCVQQGNILWVRADLVDFWRLARAEGWRLQQHYLLYPNPWPKPGHLQRRWHGHAVFPDLIALGGRLELRSNWSVYVDEFATALGLCCGETPAVEQFTPAQAITPFERKYADRGEPLYRLQEELPYRR